MRAKRLTAKLTIACDPIWLAVVEEQAKLCGLTRTEFVRRAVWETEIAELPSHDYSTFTLQLSRLGNLYNQTVKLAHETRHASNSLPTDALLRAVREHQSTLVAIRHAINVSTPRAAQR